MATSRDKRILDPAQMSRKVAFNLLKDQLSNLTNDELERLEDEIEFELWERAQLEDYEQFYGEDDDFEEKSN